MCPVTPHLLEASRFTAEASARCVFGASLGDPVADEILAALRRAGDDGMTRTQISDLFDRHESRARLGRALGVFERAALARRGYRETKGRRAELWYAVAK